MQLYNAINIGVLLPSRGLLFTETFKELLAELEPYRHKIYFSHGNSLPDCFNRPLVRALNGNHTYIWIVEDDMVLKPGILKELLEYDVPIVACDYPLAETPSGTVLYDSDNQAIFTGTGCMLIKTEALLGMPKPVFRSDIRWDFRQYGDKVKFVAQDCNPDEAYGYHDITFGLYHYINKTPIVVAKTTLAQRKLVRKGTAENNIGTDQIVLYDKYKKIEACLISREEIELAENDPLCLVSLNGKSTYMSKVKARKLEELGLIELNVINAYKNIMVDTNNIKKVIKYFKRTK